MRRWLIVGVLGAFLLAGPTGTSISYAQKSPKPVKGKLKAKKQIKTKKAREEERKKAKKTAKLKKYKKLRAKKVNP